MELAATVLQASHAVIIETALWHIAIAAYLVAIALDEIDFRSLLANTWLARHYDPLMMKALSALDNPLCLLGKPHPQAVAGYPVFPYPVENPVQ